MEALSLLINRYEKKILGYLSFRLKIKQELAEEALQEIFLKLYLNIRQFNPNLGIKFSSWLYRIAYHYAIDQKRHEKRFQAEILPAHWELPDKINGQLSVEIKNDFWILFAQLSPLLQEIVYFRFIAEKSYEEISDILQIPFGSVGTYLRAANKVFQEELR